MKQYSSTAGHYYDIEVELPKIIVSLYYFFDYCVHSTFIG